MPASSPNKIPGLREALNDGNRLDILSYRKPFEETILGRLIDREIDLQEIDTFLTPIDKWLIRNHFDVPRVDASSWRLRLEGTFNNPSSLSINDIKKFKVLSQVVTIECNGNSALTGKVMKKVKPFRMIYKGINYINPLKWKELFDFLNRGARNGMMSTAEFTGIRLLDLLEEHPLRSDTKELIFTGLDKGYDRIMDYLTMRKIHYERSFSLEEIRKYNPILCYEMNGEPLPVMHGHPLRVIFPGAQGSDHMKWLGSITATTEHFTGHFMENYYRNEVITIENGKSIVKSYPARKQKVKSAVIRVLKKNSTVNVYGVAWCGKNPVSEVSVSVDGGLTWSPASLMHEPGPFRWVFFKHGFDNLPQGTTTIVSRAKDSGGNSQPLEREAEVFYGNNAVIPVTVEIP